VAAVVKACAAAGTSIVPQGGNTGLVVGSVARRQRHAGGAEPAAPEHASAPSTPSNLTMTVDAGCVLQSLQEAADQAGFLFPLSLAAEGSCTIGGNLATNAGGTQVRALRQHARAVPGPRSGHAQGEIWEGPAACARTTPATTCATCSSAAKARWASSPPPP
jgi:hypothetical protein